MYLYKKNCFNKCRRNFRSSCRNVLDRLSMGLCPINKKFNILPSIFLHHGGHTENSTGRYPHARFLRAIFVLTSFIWRQLRSLGHKSHYIKLLQRTTDTNKLNSEQGNEKNISFLVITLLFYRILFEA